MQRHYPCQDDGKAFRVLDGQELEVALQSVRVADVQLLGPLLQWKLPQLIGSLNRRVLHFADREEAEDVSRSSSASAGQRPTSGDADNLGARTISFRSAGPRSRNNCRGCVAVPFQRSHFAL